MRALVQWLGNPPAYTGYSIRHHHTIADKTKCKSGRTNPRKRATHISLRGIISRYPYPFPPNFGFRPLTPTDGSHFGPTWMRPQCELEM